MKSKNNFIFFISLLLVTSCNDLRSNEHNFNLKNTLSSPVAPLITQNKFDEKLLTSTKDFYKDSFKEKAMLNFDVLPPENEHVIKGEITVIFKNSFKVRINHDQKSLISKVGSDISVINNLLNTKRIISGHSLNIDKSEEQLDKMQNDFMRDTGVDIPHISSIHYYKFPVDVDTKELCRELMKLNFVRVAYPSPQYEPQVSFSSPLNNISKMSPQPNDIITSQDYWIDIHKIMEAWNYYNINVGTITPKIAIIESGGFLVNSSELNYIPNSGYNIDPYGNILNQQCANNFCVNASSPPLGPHGHAVACAAAGKRNNNLGSAGVSPGALILPLKVNLSSNGSVPKAIYLAADDINDVDVINISISAGSTSLNNYADVNTAISYAAGNGTNSNGSYISGRYKPVVLAAGNNNNAINSNSYTYAFVVGGSQISTNTSRPIKASFSNFYNPSLSGYNMIALSASSTNIMYLGEDNTRKAGSGTSLAAPMVAATISMARKINPNITLNRLYDSIVGGSNIEKSNDNYGGTSNTFLGRDLQYDYNNLGKVAGLRNLNVLNSLVLARNIPNYQFIGRLFNADRDLYLGMSTNSSIFGPYVNITYGEDKIYGINSVPSGYNYTNFIEHSMVNGGCTYGYQFYRSDYSNPLVYDRVGGVRGVAGTTSGCVSDSYNYNYQYGFYW